MSAINTTRIKSVLKVETDLSVYEAAKARIRWCYENYDEVVCTYSGGKDSMIIVLLCREVLLEMGRPDQKVNVVFFDEEFVFPETIEAVEKMFVLPWVKGFWLCVPMSHEIVREDGSFRPITLWDKTRKNTRPVPSSAIVTEKQYGTPQGDKAVRELLFQGTTRIAYLLGLRAEESMTRESTIMARHKKGAHCFYFHSKHAPGIDVVTPVYDWKMIDVFYYIKNQDTLELNKMYFLEMLNRRALRVGSPLHGKEMAHLHDIKLKNPQFYEMLVSIFPDFATTTNYVGALMKHGDYDSLVKKYGCTLRGVRQLIEDSVSDPELKLFALKKMKGFIRDYIVFDRYKKYNHTRESAIRFLMKEMSKGAYDRTIMLLIIPPKKIKTSKI